MMRLGPAARVFAMGTAVDMRNYAEPNFMPSGTHWIVLDGRTCRRKRQIMKLGMCLLGSA